MKIVAAALIAASLAVPATAHATFRSASRFVFTLFSAILNDVNAKGVSRAGFTPI
jgi:hypothetical protein